MYYGKIETCDTANGEGVRVTLFVSGCTRHCKNCFNPETWDFWYGEEFTGKTIAWLIDLLKPDHISGLTILGGEPMEPSNQASIFALLSAVRDQFGDSKNIWMYTGCTYGKDFNDQFSKYVTSWTYGIFDMIDVLVDGEFIEEKKNLMLKFRGSENQRVINMPETLKTRKVVLYLE